MIPQQVVDRQRNYVLITVTLETIALTLVSPLEIVHMVSST